MTGGASAATTPTPVENLTTTTTPTETPSTSADFASHVPRRDVLRRRSQNLKQLAKCYRDHYWALMEDLKIHYRDYYWNYGVSPVHENNNNNNGGGDGDNDKFNRRCSSIGCKLTAMALTSFCQLHILSDSKQRLYKACDYVIKRPIAPICSNDMQDIYSILPRKVIRKLESRSAEGRRCTYQMVVFKEKCGLRIGIFG
ncbi:uncharacterized protein LOC126781939 isoform X2 [Argentina anserina]|uniref:uncharacterized protein LOC126781939 isoform X2 n=1 Tax=Argentina anserina TaxID=57926 RepID=UPI002176356E|nr:uncharacterized protein LOC126781939 isoform X2 [Potentilla anserina]